jgi:hypothetical protein
MNMLLLWISGLIFITCLYGFSQVFNPPWLLLFGAVFGERGYHLDIYRGESNAITTQEYMGDTRALVVERR